VGFRAVVAPWRQVGFVGKPVQEDPYRIERDRVQITGPGVHRGQRNTRLPLRIEDVGRVVPGAAEHAVQHGERPRPSSQHTQPARHLGHLGAGPVD
jgi:hypothetical protein